MPKTKHGNHSPRRHRSYSHSRDSHSPKRDHHRSHHEKSKNQDNHRDRRDRRDSRSGSRHRYKHHNEVRDRRKRSNSKEGNQGVKMIFDFEVFLESEYIKNLSEDNERAIKNIQDEFGIKRIEFDHDHMIPGLAGSVIKIQDNSYSAKHDALQAILKAAFHDHHRDSTKNHSLTILVPEGMVSLLIGARGKQINNIMKDSKTHIVVNPAIQNMTYRTVHIDGTMQHICQACEIIYRTLEDISPNVENIEKLPEPLELHKTKLTAKIVFPKSSVGFIIGKEGGWIKELCEKHFISIKFQQDFSIRCVKKDEAICVSLRVKIYSQMLNGSLADIIDSITILLKRFHEFENVSKHYAYDVVKLLIPNTYVTKLIGASTVISNDPNLRGMHDP